MVTFCPFCGLQHTLKEERSPNGGELYVAEELETCTECFDPDIAIYTCKSCNERFYTRES